MEKLIVKNFGPIKEAEIDLTKYVVFIGDTSTGKSVLAKLIAIFRDSLYIFKFETTPEFPNGKHSLVFDLKNQLKNYNINFELKSTEIVYKNSDYEISFSNGRFKFIGFNGFKKNEIGKLKDNFLSVWYDNEYKNLNPLREHKKGISAKTQNVFLYVPAERILIPLTSSSLSGLWANNVALPQCFKDFAAEYEVARRDLKIVNYNSFGFSYYYENEIDKVLIKDRKVALNEASSGIQSLIPMLIVLDHEVFVDENHPPDNLVFNSKSIVIEEPELNLFPIRQKMLIEHIGQRIKNRKFNLLITTHSPYILSVLDTLILAKNTYNEHPELKDEIATIVSEDKWIDYNDISVYKVLNDGTIRSIKNEEFKSIDTNAIDRVSDIISEEFDKLTELRYAQ